MWGDMMDFRMSGSGPLYGSFMGTPVPPDVGFQMFVGTSVGLKDDCQIWRKPPGCTFVAILTIGAGTSGQPCANVATGGGGAAGCSGGYEYKLFPAWVIPDTLVIKAPYGPLANNVSGGTAIALQPNNVFTSAGIPEEYQFSLAGNTYSSVYLDSPGSFCDFGRAAAAGITSQTVSSAGVGGSVTVLSTGWGGQLSGHGLWGTPPNYTPTVGGAGSTGGSTGGVGGNGAWQLNITAWGGAGPTAATDTGGALAHSALNQFSQEESDGFHAANTELAGLHTPWRPWFMSFPGGSGTGDSTGKATKAGKGDPGTGGGGGPGCGANPLVAAGDGGDGAVVIWAW